MDYLKGFSLYVSIAVLYSIISICSGNSQIPMSVLKKQSQMKSTDQFVMNMMNSRPPAGISLKTNERNIYSSSTQTGFNEQAVSIMANQIATPDVCEPRLMSVPIPPDSDPKVMFWPTCTKLEQCGGCCGHDLLECTPTSSEIVVVQVMKQRLSDDGSGRYDYVGNVDVPLKRHKACECQCKTKPADCNADSQYYDDASCTCRCRNADMATSCVLPKKWEEKHCRCTCPTLKNCLDDEYFDFNTCSCVRGVPASAGVVGLRASDPCTASPCRLGMKAILVSGTCQCRRARRSP